MKRIAVEKHHKACDVFDDLSQAGDKCMIARPNGSFPVEVECTAGNRTIFDGRRRSSVLFLGVNMQHYLSEQRRRT